MAASLTISAARVGTEVQTLPIAATATETTLAPARIPVRMQPHRLTAKLTTEERKGLFFMIRVFQPFNEFIDDLSELGLVTAHEDRILPRQDTESPSVVRQTFTPRGSVPGIMPRPVVFLSPCVMAATPNRVW
jgi:hypothetical protein